MSILWLGAIVSANFLEEQKSLNLSGSVLAIAVTGVVVAVAIAFDWLWGHPLQLSQTITLPLLVSTGLTVIVGYWAVPFLLALKTGQIIREEGPQSHHAKAGTPTMGGLFFILTAVVVTGVITQLSSTALAAITLTLLYGGVGLLDDWQVIQRKSNKGISPRTKLLLQVGGAIAFGGWLFLFGGAEITTIRFAFGWTIPLGALFWLLALFVPVAQSNATNLTDGLDGLAAGTSALAFVGLAILTAGQFPDLMVFSACMSGACLGFLYYNRNPAAVFMGDTGSLAIGGAMAAIALIAGQLFSLFILSGIFFAESLSVIAQVSYYKATKNGEGVGKRLFKMAPLHHHFELSGWSELKVVAIFYSVTALLLGTAICLGVYFP
ncbi:MAG: phospho-N-acetylmuramoyl-pentapeptide-transferase [Leptolyngbyaceae bacterium]|nr:phospho-N-acetylmuramoyl-pentapeptide-transferase [Leptolyngbyaceae bacterium]